MLSQELDYRAERKAFPTYQLDQLTQQIGGENITLNTNGGQTSIFEIPSVGFNLSKSFFSFDVNLVRGGNNGAAPAVDYFTLYFQAILSMIQQIQYYGKNKTGMMCDLTDFERYSKVILNGCQSIEDLLTNDKSNPLHRNNVLRNDPGGTRVATFGNSDLNYTEQQYIISTAAANTASTYKFKIPLSIFKNTILALDKDLYFGNITYLKIYWGPYANIGYRSTNNTGQAANPVEIGAPIDPNTSNNISNLYFYLATETNETITNSLREQVESPTGLVTMFDYTHAINVPVPAATKSTFYVKYGPGMGLRLKRILVVPQFTNPAAPNTAALKYSSSNINGGLINNFYTKFDSKRLIPFNINCTDNLGNQDYLIMYPLLKGSSIQSLNIYQYNWFWAEVFDGMKLYENDDNLIAGIPIDSIERKYDWVATLPVATEITYFVFGVVQRQLKITSLGIEVL